MIVLSQSLEADPQSYLRVAWDIYQNGSFGIYHSGPFGSGTARTASRSPLYPLLLAGSFFSQLPQSIAASLGFLHVVLNMATVVAVWRLGLSWKLPPACSLLAAGLVAFDPILIHQAAIVVPDTLTVLLVTITLLAMTRAARDDSLRASIIAGICGGTCVLCDADLLPWLAVVAVVALFRLRGQRRTWRWLPAMLAATAVVAPWAIRNQLVFGFPVITNTDRGFELLLGNNPTYYEHLRTAPLGQGWDASEFRKSWEARQLWVAVPNGIKFKEVEANHRAYAEAWIDVATDPAMFAYASLLRLERLWGVLPWQTERGGAVARGGFRHSLRWAVAIWYVLELSLMAVGLWLLRRRLWREPWLWATLLLVTFTLVHAFWWTDLSTRAPLSSVIALAAAYGAVSLARPRRAATSPPAAT